MSGPINNNTPPPEMANAPPPSNPDALKTFLTNLQGTYLNQFLGAEQDILTNIGNADPASQAIVSLAVAERSVAQAALDYIDDALKALGGPELPKGPSNSNPITLYAGGAFQGVSGNAFLGGLVMVTLIECMQELVKSQQFREKVDSNLWLDTQDMLKDLASATADLIKESAKNEFMKHMLLAAASAAGGIASMGCGIKGMKSDNAMSWNAVGTGANALVGSQGAFGHLVEGFFGLKKGDLDALKEIFDNVSKQLQSMGDKISEDEKDARDAINQFVQAFTQWCDKMHDMIKSLTAQG